MIKFPAPYVRKKLFSLLNGSVMFGSGDVAVYEGEGILVENQIIIGEYSHTRVFNKHCFRYDAQQRIEVITIKNDPTSKNVDAIAESVMNIIQGVDGLGDISTDDFQMVVTGENVDTVREETSSGKKVLRRFITYNLSIEQV